MTNPTDLNRELAEALDWKYKGNVIHENAAGMLSMLTDDNDQFANLVYFRPSTDKAQAMDLLIEFRLSVWAHANGDWCVTRRILGNDITVKGSTPMEAITRAVIKSLESENV